MMCGDDSHASAASSQDRHGLGEEEENSNFQKVVVRPGLERSTHRTAPTDPQAGEIGWEKSITPARSEVM